MPVVVLSSPGWHLSGVNTMNARLCEGLRELGHEVEILLTEVPAGACGELARETRLPLHSLSAPPGASWPRRWAALIEFLSARAPCVYFPGYDFDGAAVCPALPPTVATIGVLHSDEPVYYQLAQRLMRSWNGLVGVSSHLANWAAREFPESRARIRHIPYGVRIPSSVPTRTSQPGVLRAMLVGRIWDHQKRVMDLPPILAELARAGTAVEVTVVGEGPEEIPLRQACAGFANQGLVRFAGNLPNEQVLRLLEEQDVILLLSAYEGLPLVLLEAMGRGCIPVVTDIASGIPDLVEDGVSGFRLPIGDAVGFASALQQLQKDPAKREAFSRAAFAAVDQGRYRIADMARGYAELIAEVLAEARAGRSPGRNGRLAPPRHLRPLTRWRTALSRRVRGVCSMRSEVWFR